MKISQKTYDELADLARRIHLSLANYSPRTQRICEKVANGSYIDGKYFFPITEKEEYYRVSPKLRHLVRALVALECAQAKGKFHKDIYPWYKTALEELVIFDKPTPKQENKMSNMSADFTKPVQSFTRIFGIETSDLSEEQIIDLIRKAQAEAESYKDLTRSTKIAKRVDQIEIGIKALYALLDGE
jgi:hypothetical protein